MMMMIVDEDEERCVSIINFYLLLKYTVLKEVAGRFIGS